MAKVEKTQRKRVEDVFSALFCGAVAGAVAKTTVAPLDRTKILFQTSTMQFSLKTAAKLLVKMYEENGIRSLWRGNSATMARIMPYAAIQFMAHEQFKNLLRQNSQSTKPLKSPGRRFLAGSLAGVTASSLTYPLDLVRARMAVSHQEDYRDLIQSFRALMRGGSILRLYHGFVPTVLGIAIYSGISFFTYESLKKNFTDGEKKRDLRLRERFFFGALAGICGQSTSYPLDIVRRRMQTSGTLGGGHSALGLTSAIAQDYGTLRSTALHVISSEGIRRGMYKGLSLNWIKGPIAVGVSFTVYDLLTKFIRET
ncbi:mitochondrial coenzyme A transporter SLC25A42-like [Oscarella lobularis]|uniref:mitochondrial coenzyme A transporter SLC25A42-like n=1 Tax=Oscarella lobularis TaxID=121494 RepID=UPI003313B482